ncbi:MAG: HAD family hydrolase [Polyangiaceae bacterium]
MPNLALFDFDGTITHADTFTPFLHFAVPRWRIAAGGVALSPMIAGYKLGLVSAPTMRAYLVAAGFRGRLKAEVQSAGERYGNDVIPGVLRSEAMAKIAWHKERGDRVVVVSASLDVYLSVWCRSLDLDLICSELEEREGVLTGRYRRGDCTGKEKARRVVERYDMSSYPVVFAYGDTPEDRDMLELAHKKYYRWREV